MTYTGVVYDQHFDPQNGQMKQGGFETPEQALEWAKQEAHRRAYGYVYYWVEDEETGAVLNGFGGHT
jgi:hypothetical protein